MPNISTELLRSLRLGPPERTTDYRDPRVPGFVLRARPTGVHSWRVQLPDRRWLSLGRTDEVTLADARDAAQRCRARAALGEFGPNRKPEGALTLTAVNPLRGVKRGPVDRSRVVRFRDDWAAILLKSYETDRAIQRVGPVAGLRHRRFQAWLRAKNAERYNVYVSVNAIRRGRRSRTRASIGSIRHVFLEVDEGGADIVARVDALADLPPVSYVLRTSPGRVHIFWRAEGLSVESVEALQRRLARELGTDRAATSAAQMTRLPGFLNHKRQPARAVTVDYHDVRTVHDADAFPKPPVVGMHPKRALPSRQPASVLETRWKEARICVAATPPAVSGQHGDERTFRLCLALVHRFGLDDADALELLTEWNSRCTPPWRERDLLRKIHRARQVGAGERVRTIAMAIHPVGESAQR